MGKISKKVILLGHFNVGKTSLIRKFVHARFSEKYLTTIGVTIEKKTLNLQGNEFTMIIWDIAGEISLEKTQLSFLMGAHGVIYVFDLTRESTWANITEEMEFLKKKLPCAKIKIVGNKSDLVDKTAADDILSKIPVSVDYLSSAKTGENVEEMFAELAHDML